jgi:hypothetical protein
VTTSSRDSTILISRRTCSRLLRIRLQPSFFSTPEASLSCSTFPHSYFGFLCRTMSRSALDRDLDRTSYCTNPSFPAAYFHRTELNSPRLSARFQDLFTISVPLCPRHLISDLLSVSCLLYQPGVDDDWKQTSSRMIHFSQPSRFDSHLIWCLPATSKDTT